MTEVCVDASLAIEVVVPEAGSDKADALFDHWAGEETQLIAPYSSKSKRTVFFAKGGVARSYSKQVRDKLTFVQWLGNYSPVS